tara:strand:+ start:443 stop:1384 length:942 start_codon:yes stop_codon:yes gene_type:complete
VNKYKYVVVSGCSFSACDAPNTPLPGETYGDVVADHYGAKCYNLAKSGGSIPYMHRVILKWCSQNLDKWKDTLVILGLTATSRMEIWNNKAYNILKENKKCSQRSRSGTDGPMGEEFPTRKKYEGERSSNAMDIPIIDSQSGPWYGNFGEALQHTDEDFYNSNWGHDYPFINEWTDKERKNYFINFYNDNAQFLIATQIFIGLQSFFKVNNIDYIFFDAIDSTSREVHRDYTKHHTKHELIRINNARAAKDHKLVFDNLVSQENWFSHPKYFDIMDMTERNPDMRASADDKHPNKKAHKYWGECLIEYINEKV